MQGVATVAWPLRARRWRQRGAVQRSRCLLTPAAPTAARVSIRPAAKPRPGADADGAIRQLAGQVANGVGRRASPRRKRGLLVPR